MAATWALAPDSLQGLLLTACKGFATLKVRPLTGQHRDVCAVGFFAARDLEGGDELTFTYDWEPGDTCLVSVTVGNG